jgi:hypothetical protein
MNKKMSRFIFSFVLGSIIILSNPVFALGASTVTFNGLVPVCNTKLNGNGGFSDPCDFNMVISLIDHDISYLLKYLITPLFAIIIIYAGWLYLSSGGSSENVTKAKHIFKNALIGYVIALVAWLVVSTIVHTLGFKGDTFLG